jgi:hypothetical protein
VNQSPATAGVDGDADGDRDGMGVNLSSVNSHALRDVMVEQMSRIAATESGSIRVAIDEAAAGILRLVPRRRDTLFCLWFGSQCFHQAATCRQGSVLLRNRGQQRRSMMRHGGWLVSWSAGVSDVVVWSWDVIAMMLYEPGDLRA